MPLGTKAKGSTFERLAVEILNRDVKKGIFKKIAGSGAIGTSLREPLLTGDITGSVEGFPKKFKIECKVGYGGKTQFTLKKEWLNKIIEEASQNYSFPALIGKFSGGRKSDGVQEFVVLDIDNFIYILNYITDMKKELDVLYEKYKGDVK